MEHNKDNAKPQMKRRDLLKVLGAAPAAAAALVTIGTAHAEPARFDMPGMPDAGGQMADNGAYRLQFFTPHEYKTVQLLSDWIIPADQRSGSATQAGVPEFIDDWLEFKKTVPSMSLDGQHYTYATLAEQIRGGLTWLDIDSNRRYAHDFAGCSQAQQKQTLDRLSDPHNNAPEDAAGVLFFHEIRDLVVSGFFSSKMGVSDLRYMGNVPVMEWNGCPEPALAHLKVSYNDEANNGYRPEFGIRKGGLVGDTKVY